MDFTGADNRFPSGARQSVTPKMPSRIRDENRLAGVSNAASFPCARTATRSLYCSAWARSCKTSKTALPCPASPCSNSSNSNCAATSR